MEKVNIFYTTASNDIDLESFVKNLLNKKGVVCVNTIKNVASFYKEGDRIIESVECIFLIKTILNKNELEKILIAIHPYEIPFIKEIITGKTNEDYLEWVMKNL